MLGLRAASLPAHCHPPPSPGCHIRTIRPLPLLSRPLPGSQHTLLGLEDNPWQQEIHLSPKSQGQMGTARRSLCCKEHRSRVAVALPAKGCS